MQHPMQGHPQMPPHPMIPPAFATGNITTEHIQKYLDENKQLILAILDNQNLGKLNECAQYQAKLQQNLMYLAAIADSQPQPPTAHPQMAPSAMQAGAAHYMQHQQAQVAAQSVMAGRLPMQYAATPQQMQQEHAHQQQLQQQHLQHHHQHQHQHQHQQTMHSQLGGMGGAGAAAGGSNGLQMLHNEAAAAAAAAAIGGNGPLSSGRPLPDFGRATSSGTGEGMQPSRGGLAIGNKQDTVPSETGDGHAHGGAAGHNAADESEPMYLKASEEEGS